MRPHSGQVAERADRGFRDQDAVGDAAGRWALHVSMHQPLIRGIIQGLFHEELKMGLVVKVLLALDCDADNCAHRVHGVQAPERLSTQQNAVHPVQDGVRHVCRLGAGRSWRVGHCVDHAGNERRLADHVAGRDDCLLHQAHLLWRDVQAHVAAGQDDAVSVLENVPELQQRLPRLDLGQDLGALHAHLVQSLPGLDDVRSAASEAEAQPVNLKLLADAGDGIQVRLGQDGQLVLLVDDHVAGALDVKQRQQPLEHRFRLQLAHDLGALYL
mmetsp:Transcript_11605/g.29748  ORF Transcript_11605/g.29748 Transcript_11605/m.29748 type:complete len:271 (-) Transcript_11605:775-1587(-)